MPSERRQRSRPRHSAIEYADRPADVKHAPNTCSHGARITRVEPGLFNNRELASLFWLGVVAAWLLVRHREATVSACRDLVRAFRPVAAYFAPST